MPDDATMPGTCPSCGNDGPHSVGKDFPDAEVAYRVPLTCTNCGREFSVEVADTADRPVEREPAPTGEPTDDGVESD